MDMNQMGHYGLPKNCRERILDNEYADYIISYNGDEQEIRDYFQGECLTFLDQNLALITIRRQDINLMSVISQLYYMVPKCYGLMDTTSLEESGIIKTQNQPVLNLKGRKVLVGVIDTGIDYQNPIFRYVNGRTRIRSIWDQSIQSGEPPENYLYGTEYTESMINQALQSESPLSIVPSVDTNGHGTFVAGIIAGGEDEANDFIGAAPMAELIVVKLKQAKQYLKDFYFINAEEVYQETDIMMAVDYLLKQSAKWQMPMCIYLGVGTNSGDHTGRGPLNEYLTRVNSFPGRFVSVPVGNEGNARRHFAGAVNETEEYETVEINVGASEPGIILELWGEAPNTYAVGFESPYGEIISRVPPNFLLNQTVYFGLERTVVEVSYVLVEEFSGKQLIFIRMKEPTEGVWKLRIYAVGTIQNDFNIWMPIRQFLSEDTFFLRPEPNVTLTEPSTAEGPTGSTAYNHVTNSLYLEAGRGFTAAGGIKPDLAAPGVNVYGPTSIRKPDGSFAYTRRSGSSIAAAHTTGAAALIMEWATNRNLLVRINGETVKRYLIRGAKRKPELSYPNRLWGYGTLDLYGTFQSLQQQDIF